ncbi:MAG: hypoxanthine phosphoribosyltransferase [Thermoguttaceae bacterium]|nr:hypoxanthine phosphoribosyltransferase [Thermoguttaceae bacterium]MBQ7111894.1 hypoxanthine phosphoribosyltransferase [Thermoguttaceae bacterium]
MKIYFTAEEIAAAVERVASQINGYYPNDNDDKVLVVGVLKGATIFFADLVRKFDFPLEIDFVRAASYGDARVSSGTVALTKDVETPLEGRRVLIVEDMIDSGRSLKRLRDHFLSRGAAEVCIVVLIDKKTKRAVDVPVEWSALESEDLFLLGYGLDDGERGRNLPDLWVVD